MNLLKRSLAPIPASAWEQIDDEARAVFDSYLGGRKLVDLDGPHGWDFAAVNTGRISAPQVDLGDGVEAGRREVVPLVELRAPFRLRIDEMDAAARGADDLDLDPLIAAAEKIAAIENRLIFTGLDGLPKGIVPASRHEAIQLSDEPADYLQAVVDAELTLRRAGVAGPYGLALGTHAYQRLTAATDDGYPVRNSISRILEGPIVWVPQCDGAALLSLRGGDFVLTVGQDLSIGYLSHDRETVELFLVESIAFRVLDPTAAVAFQYA